MPLIITKIPAYINRRFVLVILRSRRRNSMNLPNQPSGKSVQVLTKSLKSENKVNVFQYSKYLRIFPLRQFILITKTMLQHMF